MSCGGTTCTMTSHDIRASKPFAGIAEQSSNLIRPTWWIRR
jgi:hypothetical protein